MHLFIYMYINKCIYVYTVEIVDRSRNFLDRKILITDSESAQKEGLGGAQQHMTHGIIP